jgi:hypothetical protein
MKNMYYEKEDACKGMCYDKRNTCKSREVPFCDSE